LQNCHRVRNVAGKSRVFHCLLSLCRQLYQSERGHQAASRTSWLDPVAKRIDRRDKQGSGDSNDGTGKLFSRHSPDELWNGVDGSRRQSSPKATGGLCSAPSVSVVPGVPNDVRSADLALFPVIQTHSLRGDDASDRASPTLGPVLVAVRRSAARFPGTIPSAPRPRPSGR